MACGYIFQDAPGCPSEIHPPDAQLTHARGRVTAHGQAGTIKHASAHPWRYPVRRSRCRWRRPRHDSGGSRRRTSYEITTELTDGTLRFEAADSVGNYPSGRVDVTAQQLARAADCRSWTALPTTGAPPGTTRPVFGAFSSYRKGSWRMDTASRLHRRRIVRSAPFGCRHRPRAAQIADPGGLRCRSVSPALAGRSRTFGGLSATWAGTGSRGGWGPGWRWVPWRCSR
jgi:hypothetical protein